MHLHTVFSGGIAPQDAICQAGMGSKVYVHGTTKFGVVVGQSAIYQGRCATGSHADATTKTRGCVVCYQVVYQQWTAAIQGNGAATSVGKVVLHDAVYQHRI